MNTQSFNGKVAYITGGSKGIGYGIAASLLNCGVKVAISGRTLSNVKNAASKLSSSGENILAIESDVRNLASERNAVKQVVDKFGKLDILIANAGVGHFVAIDQMSKEIWDQTIDTNLTGVFHSVRAAVDELKKTKGYLITIASLAGTNFFENGAAYNASKFGLVGFTQAVMLDLRKYDVKVSTIMPGSVASHFNDHSPSETDSWKLQPEDIGELVVDMLKTNPRSLPSKVEIRPAKPVKK